MTKMKTKQEVDEFRLIINKCDNQRDHLDGSLNRMHLAKNYDELREWYNWSKVHLIELGKLLSQKVQFIVEHSAQKEEGGKNE